HGVEIGDLHLGKGLVAQDACIVDHDVDAAEGIHRDLHDVGGGSRVRDAVVAGNRFAALRLDLGNHLVGRLGGTAGAIHRAAQVVHYHFRAALGQQQRMAAAEAGAGAGDNGNAAVEIDGHDF